MRQRNCLYFENMFPKAQEIFSGWNTISFEYNHENEGGFI